MTNGEKYKTAQERAEAFENYCKCHKECHGCTLYNHCIRCTDGALYWLDLLAEEEKPMPCPFCGDSCYSTKRELEGYVVSCSNGGCNYCSGEYDTESDAIAAHNRVAKAVRESEGK